MFVEHTEEEKKSQEGSEEEVSGDVEGEGGEGVSQNKGKRPKLAIIIASVFALILIASAGLFVMKKLSTGGGHQSSNAEHGGAEHGEGAKGPSKAFIDVDPFLVNLNTGGKGASFLKLKIKLEVSDPKDRSTIEENMPKIRDIFQLYLRELRPSDMQGSVGLYRLREELLLRVNKLTYPAQVADILFDEVLVQ
ncbi:MAG: flagellar basal body-associated FliL family protein [Proteobacteria bacterium]|nr:flagellar basal body-associated FliL family protein [Pseudomonadota bacterium]